MQTQPKSKSPGLLARLRDWLSRWGTVLLLAVLVPALAMTSLSAGLLWLLTHDDRAPVLSEAPGGRVLRVELHSGIFSRAMVETDSGYYALADAVSLNKGEPLTVQEREGGRRLVCDAQHRCFSLLKPWP